MSAGRSVLHRRATRPGGRAGPLEEAAARAWNVLNEGKPFTAVFGIALLLVTGAGWRGITAVAPLLLAWWRHAYPLHLRAILWLVAGAAVYAAGGLPVGPAALGLALYLLFTIVLWGSVYYHLRIGAPLTNFTRFWRLVVENPDPTSGNLLEQVPKVAAVLAVGHSTRGVAGLWMLGAAVGLAGAAVHARLVTWVPARATGDMAAARRPRRPRARACGPSSRKVVLLVIDGCRLDRLREARTPFLDRLAREGIAYDACETVYPARTVTGFSSMLTGAPPAVHGMRSNFVPSLGVKCESLFDVVPRARMVGIAHLVDAFGDAVHTVTAVTPNDEIDAALCARARQVVEDEDPDLLVVQTLSVDQTGHFRGSYYDEYLERIESTDRELESFVDWLGERWGGLEGVTIGVLSDHGQGRGIGGHGHWSEPERHVPCVWWGAGVPRDAPRADASLLDVAATVAHRLGVRPPDRSVGACLLCEPDRTIVPPPRSGPVVVVLPAHDEEETVASVVSAVPRVVDDITVEVVVVDDGSRDATVSRARAAGATVIEHGHNQGLGAAVRSGFAHARSRGAAAVAFLDADGEYDPADLPRLLEPVLSGEADYVIGSRFAGTIERMLPARRFGNRVFTALTSLVARHRLSDAQSGFRALNADALAVARIRHDYNYAQVLTLDLLRKGMRYAEVPIGYRFRQAGHSFVRPWPYLRHVLPALLLATRAR